MIEPATQVGFDIKAYNATPFDSHSTPQVTLDQIDLETEEILVFLGNVLQSTAEWLSHVLVTPTHKEARITAVLTTWTYERYWMGKTLLNLIPKSADAESDRVCYSVSHKPSRLQRLKKRSPLISALLANLQGRVLIGAQMTERLVDCWALSATLDQVEGHMPAEAMPQIAAIKTALARQAKFFQEVAEQELRANKKTQSFTRHRLAKLSFPLGAPHSKMPPRVWATLSLLPPAKQQILNRLHLRHGLDTATLRFF